MLPPQVCKLSGPQVQACGKLGEWKVALSLNFQVSCFVSSHVCASPFTLSDRWQWSATTCRGPRMLKLHFLTPLWGATRCRWLIGVSPSVK